MKRLGIVGAPCSGTHFTAHCLAKIGLEVGNEAGPKRDGECSWKAVSRPLGTFDVVFHQVRAPLLAISGLQALRYDFWDEAGLACELPPESRTVERCCEFWMQWNAFCEGRASRTYRVEDIDDEWPQILEAAGHAPGPVPNVRRNFNSKRHKYRRFDESDLRNALSAERWQELINQCQRYGYEGVA